MKDYAFICGGASPHDLKTADQVLRLDVAGPDRNVNLRLSDVNRALLSHLPDLLIDLLELSVYVYCADQRARRGSEKLSNAGEYWRRHLHFIVPVRCLDLWSSAAVREPLEEMLGYLSDDLYTFDFVRSETPFVERQIYFDELVEGSGFEPDDVVLFSGGVDSLAGVVDCLTDGRKIAMVGHHSAPKVVNIQKELVTDLRRAGFGRQMFHVTVNVTNMGVDPVEPTQRTRSFLFASLAFVLARMFGLDRLTFYENGVVSLNLPIAGDVLGARATRTTHPKVMRGFETFFSQLVGRQITIETPYLWLTKKDIVEKLVSRGQGDLLGKSVSCVHPIAWTKDVRHCGTCSQCIDRRFAVLAAGVEQYDAAESYRIDLLTGDRSHEELDPATAYVKFARTIMKLDRADFQSEYPQVSSALHSVPGLSANEVLDRAWRLHQRHAEGVLSVLSDATKKSANDLVYGRIAPGSLLRLCFARGPIQSVGPDTTAQISAFMDRMSAATCEFAVDEIGERICFRGGYSINGAGFQVIRVLVDPHRDAKRRDAEVPFYLAYDLAVALNLDEPALRRRVGRLREEAEARLAVDQGVVLPQGLIENRKPMGYRLSPELREVALADINSGCHK